MLEFAWKIFEETGNIDTYLLFKELEKDEQDKQILGDQLFNEIDSVS